MSNEKQRSPRGKRLKLLTILYHASAEGFTPLNMSFLSKKEKNHS